MCIFSKTDTIPIDYTDNDSILGPVTIGHNTRVAAGSVVLKNLPANVTAAGVPAIIVRENGERVVPSDDLNQRDIPDVVLTRLEALEKEIAELKDARE